MMKQAALITGAGSAIGRASALALAGQGYSVGLLARSRDELATAVAEISAGGGEALAPEADISREDELRGAVDCLVKDANTSSRNEDETAIPVLWPKGQVPITGGKPGRSEDVADLICFLASEKAGHITGTPIWIDGGQGLLR